MSILSTIFKMKRWIKTDEGYKPCSEWQKASEVEFDSGSNAETTLGAINGITSSLNTNNDNYALSAAGGYNLQSQVTTLSNKAITTDNIKNQTVKSATSATNATNATNASKVPWSGITGKPSTYPPAAHNHQFGSLELMYTTPFIDFHYNNSTKDYTTRIIDDGSGLHFLNALNNSFAFHGHLGHQVTIGTTGEFISYNGSVVLRSPTNVQCTDIAGNTYIPVLGASFTNPSSKLVKENINDMSEDEAKKVLQLKPVTFDYVKEFGGEHNQRGLIAEETLKIIPSCVNVPENYSEAEFDIKKGIDNKVLAIDYSKLIPYLIKIVQMQQGEIEKLKEAMNKNN